MKNTILILISILMVVCGTLLMVSSSEDYAAEKLFYRAMKINREIAINPDVAPPAMLASVENTLEKILEKYPKSKTAKGAHLILAGFYVDYKKYDRAHTALDEILNTYGEDRILLSKAHFLKGAAYERQNQWNEALKEYTILRDEYTDTPLGLSVPLYIGNYYTGKERPAQAERAYQEAALFYEKLESENKGEVFGYAAANLLFQAYMNLKQYEKAGKVIEDTVNNYPEQILAQQLPNIELIFIKMLNKPEKATELYENIRERTNNPKLKIFLDEKIKALKAQK